MNRIRKRLKTGLAITAGVLVTIFAVAQSTELLRLHQSCQSIGKTWTKFNCLFVSDQERCLGLEIAYEGSPECESITRRNGTIQFVPEVPVRRALDFYFDAAFDIDNVNDCYSACDDPTGLRLLSDCCSRLCEVAFAPPTLPAGGSCPF